MKKIWAFKVAQNAIAVSNARRRKNTPPACVYVQRGGVGGCALPFAQVAALMQVATKPHRAASTYCTCRVV